MTVVGVVAALEREARALAGPSLAHRRGAPPRLFGADPTELAPGVWLVVAGVGPERAARAGRLLVQSGARALVSWGVAGGLDTALRPGALVLATEVVDGARTWSVDAAWRGRLEARLAAAGSGGHAFRAAPIAASARVLAAAAEKAACGRASGAAAVDMESGALAELAAAEGLSLLCVRAVCDPVETSLPRCVLAGADGSGASRAELLRSLALGPWQLPGVLALRAGFRAALRTLGAVARAAGPDLCAGEAA